MKSFVLYFLERAFFNNEMLLNECEKTDKLASYFYDKYNNLQYKDIEETIEDIQGKEKGISDRSLMKKAEDTLSSMNKKKKQTKKELSCVQAIKKSMPSDQEEKSIYRLMKRAEKFLTNQEKKILDMCSKGKSVRTIGSELGISYPTAWRHLNSAIDKIRMSHGIRSRNRDLRRRGH
jgi:DNA-binding CsgD family transcriptional regulator